MSRACKNKKLLTLLLIALVIAGVFGSGLPAGMHELGVGVAHARG